MMRTYSVVTGLHDKEKVPWIKEERVGGRAGYL